MSEGIPEHPDRYKIFKIDGITVYLAVNLDVKPGHKDITIKLRRFLFFRWLELEGAKSITLYN